MENLRDIESLHIKKREDSYPSNQGADGFLAKVTKLENTILIHNLILEIVLAIFDQLSSVHKPQYRLVSMVLSFLVLFISILDLVHKGRKKRVRLMMKCWIPWFYYPSPNHSKPFGKFFDIMGLICGILQCVFASIAYCFLSNNEDNPIKLNFWPIVFAVGLLFSKITSQSNEPSSHIDKEGRENVETRRLLPIIEELPYRLAVIRLAQDNTQDQERKRLLIEKLAKLETRKLRSIMEELPSRLNVISEAQDIAQDEEKKRSLIGLLAKLEANHPFTHFLKIVLELE